ncbi:uncharacterized protein M6B38_278110 [Iris pallida]|uniref:SMP-LTD domain-containing protein n=1 Tax=Iris pallida TaxID=29817 RepID=A0AAX6HZ66_IRIPA|nr:uncharacterized protein M6B38_278110 [Iris pallida]
MLLFFLFALGFLLGAFSLAAAEGFVLYRLLGTLLRRSEAEAKAAPASAGADLDGAEPPLGSPVSKEGIVWVLEEPSTRGPKEVKNKKGIIEVYPQKKHAKIKGGTLGLSDLDGSQADIKLSDCTILAVSGSDLSTRKWAKRYPIKLESKSSIIYNGSKTCYIYLETSWEKESWCKALRLASCSDKEKLNWFAHLTKEFHQYLVSLSGEDPSFLKPPAMLFDEATDKSNRVDGSSSRVRSFLKKFTKKATKKSTKNGIERKTSVSSSNVERKFPVKTRSLLAVSSSDGSTRNSLEDNSLNNSLQDVVQSSSPTSGKNMLHIIPDSDIGEKIVNGEGTLSWNLLLSRLCFDAVRSKGLNDAIKARIQRSLLNMRTPSYIGGVICTGLDLGNLPPIIHKIRVLPVDLNEAWTVEVDIEYSGGLVLDVETRIEICEPELEKDFMGTSYAPSSVGEVTSDLLEGIEYYENQLRSSSSPSLMENSDEVDKVDGLKQIKSTKWASGYASRWKAAVHSIANQVSQVPLSLAIRIASIRGTLRLHIKPPPSDQLWFAFTSMPEIDWNFDSSIGERKITSAHVALLIGNRFKAAIREYLVLPNYENISIPWMLAEKDDWVARKVAPFLWASQEATDTSGLESTISHPEEGKMKLGGSNGNATAPHSNNKVEGTKNVVSQQPPEQSVSGSDASNSDSFALVSTNASNSDSFALVSTNQVLCNTESGELRQPLLKREETQRSQEQIAVESPKTSSSSEEMVITEQDTVISEEDLKPKRMGSSRRKMFDLGKKMGERLGEKFEEQKRSIGEKGRHFGERGRHLVERIREKQSRDV